MVREDLVNLHLITLGVNIVLFVLYILAVNYSIKKSLSKPIQLLNKEIEFGGKHLKQSKKKLGDEQAYNTEENIEHQSTVTLGNESNVTDDGSGRRDSDAFNFDNLDELFRGDDDDRSNIRKTTRHSIAKGVKKRASKAHRRSI